MPVAGILLKIASALIFTLMSATVKELSSRYPVGQLVFSRSAFALVPLIIWLMTQGPLINALKTRNPRGHLGRGLIGAAGMGCGFVALSLMPLPDAVAFGYVAPLLTVVMAALILKETVRIYRWSAVAVGFFGVLVMLSPQLTGGFDRFLSSGVAVGIVFALLGACCSAGATILVRQMTHLETTGAIVFYFTLLTTLLGATTAFFGWRMPIDGWDAALMVLSGILGGIGQILLTQSYRYGDASLIAPFDYMSMIWAVLFGWVLFGEWPRNTILIGAAIVVAAGLFVIWREHKLGLLRAETRKAGPTLLK